MTHKLSYHNCYLIITVLLLNNEQIGQHTADLLRNLLDSELLLLDLRLPFDPDLLLDFVLFSLLEFLSTTLSWRAVLESLDCCKILLWCTTVFAELSSLTVKSFIYSCELIALNRVSTKSRVSVFFSQTTYLTAIQKFSYNNKYILVNRFI